MPSGASVVRVELPRRHRLLLYTISSRWPPRGEDPASLSLGVDVRRGRGFLNLLPCFRV